MTETIPGGVIFSIEGWASQQKVLSKIPQVGNCWGRLVFRFAEPWWESPRQNVTRFQMNSYDLIHELIFCRFWGKHIELLAIYCAGCQTGIMQTDRLKWFVQFWISIGFRLKISWEFIRIEYRIPWVIMLINQPTNNRRQNITSSVRASVVVIVIVLFLLARATVSAV